MHVGPRRPVARRPGSPAARRATASDVEVVAVSDVKMVASPIDDACDLHLASCVRSQEGDVRFDATRNVAGMDD